MTNLKNFENNGQILPTINKDNLTNIARILIDIQFRDFAKSKEKSN